MCVWVCVCGCVGACVYARVRARVCGWALHWSRACSAHAVAHQPFLGRGGLFMQWQPRGCLLSLMCVALLFLLRVCSLVRQDLRSVAGVVESVAAEPAAQTPQVRRPGLKCFC